MSVSKETTAQEKPKKCSHINKMVFVLTFFVILLSNSTESQMAMTPSVRFEKMSEISELDPKDIPEEMHSVFYQNQKFPEPESVRGIYLTAYTLTAPHFDDLIDTLIRYGGNAVVMDIELSGGQLAFLPENQYLASLNPGSGNIPYGQIIRELHEKGIYVIARQVVFNDPYMSQRKPEWRIKYKNSDALFDYRWIDASHPETQLYNLLVTEEVAKLGVDEVQYDYIRFPDGWNTNVDYYFDETQKEKWEVINDFLAEAHALTKELDIKLGIDVFGATIYGNIDWKIVGQNIPEVSKNVDVIYPMVYPSHVSPGYNGFQNPWGDPGTFVRESMRKFNEASNGAEMRTWIQGFPLHSPNFGSWYVEAQVKGTYDAGSTGWVVWSPGNIYNVSWSSMDMLPPPPPEPAIEGESDNF